MRVARILVACVVLAGLGSACGDDRVTEPADAGASGAAGGSGGAAGGSGGAAGDGSGGDAGTGALDSTDGDGHGDACALQQAALIAFVKANKGCSADTDCVFVKAESGVQELCPSPDFYAGGFYLNAAYDKAELATLAQALDACLPPLSPCNLSPFPAVCWNGQCEAGTEIAAKTQCISDLGGGSACTKCACGPCGYPCKGLPERPVVLCALKAGCLGTPKCDPESSDFPCKEALAEAGGGSYDRCNECIADWQCAAECAGGK